jgi:spore maturation protein CgeB
MKVLYIGNTRRTALALHYFTNLIRLGHQVLPYNADYFGATSWLEKTYQRITKQPVRKRGRQVSQDLVSLCKNNRFDLVFVMAENFIGKETLEEMKRVSSHGSPLLLYHSHDNNFSDGILKPSHFEETIKTYDAVFTTKSASVKRYQDWGQSNAFFIPCAFEPSLHHPIPENYSCLGGKQFDVTFVGTYDTSREKYLNAAGWERLEVWGDRWRRTPLYLSHRDKIHPKAIYDFEFADVTSHSKISLGLLREEAEDLHTTRTFEIPACGSLQIAPRNEEILSFFKEDSEIVCFGSLEELKSKIDYYLSHDYQRNQVALKGFERCHRDKHTYIDRVIQILATAKSLRGSLPLESVG